MRTRLGQSVHKFQPGLIRSSFDQRDLLDFRRTGSAVYVFFSARYGGRHATGMIEIVFPLASSILFLFSFSGLRDIQRHLRSMCMATHDR